MPKSKKLVSVHVYLSPDGEEQKIIDRLSNVAKWTGLSVSRVSVMAIQQGLAGVEERLLQPNQLEKIGGATKKTK